ncbi:hypothetical protein [Blastococcus capsensis]|uniref:hypothetical protein n=1 Tax=Blastococcus capsensis TaxID=1564163 RepID=UPI00254214B6|nr:hypothetical protein [Blastococcus capsensis]MDK3258912.1 hypothetical protein [Blastococcus capsensis]
MTHRHSCSDIWARLDRLGQEWTCPECGSGYVSTRAKYLRGSKLRPDVGYEDPEILGWRGGSPHPE